MEVFIQGRRGRIIARFALPVQNGSYPDPRGVGKLKVGSCFYFTAAAGFRCFCGCPQGKTTVSSVAPCP